MFSKSLAVALSAFVLLAVPVRPTAADPSPPERSPAPATARTKIPDWKTDPVCRMVFYAVLEGLYEDGVPDEVVDSIVPRQPKEGTNALKTSFVIECPLCHPVYEAFALYQKRPAFNDDAKRNTFGKGIDEALVKDLKSETPRVRLTALRVLVQRWVERRLTMMNLTDEQKKDWQKRIQERGQQGLGFLTTWIGTDPNYKGWSGYWGCAACGGSEAACRVLHASGKGSPK
jgi:hypothetical protein